MNVPPYKIAAAPSPYICFLGVVVGGKTESCFQLRDAHMGP